jgi:hypothetical protein
MVHALFQSSSTFVAERPIAARAMQHTGAMSRVTR